VSIEAIYHAVLDGDTATTQVEVKAAFEDGVSAGDILNKACIPAMTEVGRLFEEGEKFVPEMLISAHAMKTGMVLLKPHLTQQDASFAGKVVIGTVQGDLHDIGKNLVCMMLEGNGLRSH
jgi:5-methyltetrahydrofolate--homocysteine methyltransferase